MTVPPYVCGTLVLLIFAYSSDKFKERTLHILGYESSLKVFGCLADCRDKRVNPFRGGIVRHHPPTTIAFLHVADTRPARNAMQRTADVTRDSFRAFAIGVRNLQRSRTAKYKKGPR